VSTYTVSQAIDRLITEGFERADINATLNSLIEAGLELPQPDDNYVLGESDMSVLRDQLNF
jgi:hypothetical protein